MKNNQNIHNQDICSLFMALLVTHYWNLKEVLINKYFLRGWVCLSRMKVWIDSLQVMDLTFQHSQVHVCACVCVCAFMYVYLLLRIKPRALHALGKCSATKWCPSPLTTFVRLAFLDLVLHNCFG